MYGEFDSAGTFAADRLVRWNEGWVPSPGTPGFEALHDLLADGPVLYAAGRGPPGQTFRCVRRLSGSSWIGVGSFFADPAGPVVHDLLLYQGELHAAGRFERIGSVTVNGVARWDGTAWQPLGGGLTLGPGGAAWTLAVYDGRLIVGGDFVAAGGVPASRVAAWDGSSWSPLSAGLNARVRVLHVHQGDLIAGGKFTSVSFPPTSRVALWNGETWDAVGLGLTGTVRALASLGPELIAGGSFTEIPGGILGNNIARFDGTSWGPMGSGLDDRVIGLSGDETGVWVGGRFRTAGTTRSVLVARWIEPGGPAPGGPGAGFVLLHEPPIRVYPNPARDAVRFRLELARAGPASLDVFDVAGRRVRRLLAGPHPAGPSVVTWDGRSDAGAPLPAGVYFYRLETNGGTASGKVVRTGGAQ